MLKALRPNYQTVCKGALKAVRAVPSGRAAVATRAVESSDRMLRSLAANEEVAVLLLDGTVLVQEAATRHQTLPTATAALGRALMGSLLMCSFRGEDEALQVTFNAEGPLRGIQVIAESNGFVKGKVGNSMVDLPLRADGKLDVGRAVGPGTLAVVRTQKLSPVPYTGTVEITSGEIAEDLAVYLATSEQTNSAIALGVQILPDGTVAGAGGYFIQVLPFASDETLTQLEKNLSMLPAISDLVSMGMSLEKMTDLILEGIGLHEGEQQQSTPAFGPCEKSYLQTRMKRAVAALGEAEVEDILAKEGHVEVTCNFCAETYRFDETEIKFKQTDEESPSPDAV